MIKLKHILTEAIIGNSIKCDNCGWSWKIKDGGDDLYICHKCGHNNTPQLKEDPKKGTGKKPKGSSRRLYTDENPNDTVSVKFKTKQDVVDTLNKSSFKNKSHKRQSQIINLIHQRLRAAVDRTKDPKKKKRLRSAFEYIKKKKAASKEKTQRMRKSESIAPNHDGKAAPYGSGYKKVKETISGTPASSGFGNPSSNRYRAIEKRGDKYYYRQDNPFSPGITQEFGPYKTKAAAKRKMGTFPPGLNYRDVTENFADKKVKGKSRPGRVKRSGASCKGSVSSLRAKAKKYGGERGKMYHWCANMKAGKK